MTRRSGKPVQKPLLLNSKEERILHVVHNLECVTLDEIHRLLGATESRNYTGKLLRKLCGGRDYDPQHYLYRFPLPRPKQGAKERVYCLGAKARQVIPVADAYRPTKFRYLSYSPLLHDLMLSRFIVAATVYFQTHDAYQLLETRLCYQLARNPPRITVVTQEKESTVAVIPDAWLHIERVADEAAYPLWLEIDRGTENVQKFQQLLRNRLTLVNSPQYEQLFQTTAVLFCYVTTADTEAQMAARLHNLIRWTEDVFAQDKRTAWAPHFRFTTARYDTLYADTETFFTQPVWYQPTVPDPVLLFAPDAG